MNTEIIREALTEAKEAMMWELGGEPIWSLTAAARLKIEEALAALDDVKVPLPHEALRATYKEGQNWEYKFPDMSDWRGCTNWNFSPEEPRWFEECEYRLKLDGQKLT